MAFLVEGISRQRPPEAQVRRVGEYATREQAIAAAQQVVDEFLRREFKPGMAANELFSRYQSQGEFAFIFRDDDKTLNVPGFSHAQYARSRCDQLCGGRK